MLQAHLGPFLQGLSKLQYESKAVSSELDPATTAFMSGGGDRRQQLQVKAQALQQCIDDMLEQVRRNIDSKCNWHLFACNAFAWHCPVSMRSGLWLCKHAQTIATPQTCILVQYLV